MGEGRAYQKTTTLVCLYYFTTSKDLLPPFFPACQSSTILSDSILVLATSDVDDIRFYVSIGIDALSTFVLVLFLFPFF
jgi:hypothetical protein